MIVAPDKRVVPVAAIAGFRTGVDYATANPGGPAGSATMSFFFIGTFKRLPANGTKFVFLRTVAPGSTGWYIFLANQTLSAVACNSTPAAVQSPGYAITAADIGRQMIVIARYLNGTIQLWVDGVSIGTTTLGTGYTSAAAATRIGSRADGFPETTLVMSECGVLDNYDIAATVVARTAQWQEDLQHGRYLTWPRAMTADDWYWSARDAVTGIGGKVSWLDRGPNATSMARTGVPQAAQIAPRF